jgi:hypothetical protein
LRVVAAAQEALAKQAALVVRAAVVRAVEKQFPVKIPVNQVLQIRAVAAADLLFRVSPAALVDQVLLWLDINSNKKGRLGPFCLFTLF